MVWWKNFPNRGTGRAYRKLTKAMKDDAGYAQVWQSNIAMPIFDNCKGKLTHQECNDIADRLMQHLFEYEDTDALHRNPNPRA